MSGSYKVLAPYVTARVKDISGQTVVLGFYRDGIISDPVDPSHLDAMAALGMVEPTASELQEAAPEDAPGFERPAGNASQEAWRTYALESGQASEDEVKDLSRDELRELYG